MIQNQKNKIFIELNFVKSLMTSCELIGYQLIKW
jgi:hypothetical protein